jgi:3',5'-cyclic AMP phosphodiesterase CpdA
MPITLPPLTRRHWLQKSLTAGLTALAPNWLPAAVKGAESWVLFSDSHIAADAALQARGVNMAENLRRCVNQALALKQKPFGVIVNGDCVYLEGLKEDYVTFGELINPLREASLPVHCTLGNHDDRKNFMGAFTGPEDIRPVEGKHVKAMSSAAINWVLLDSLDKTNVTPGILGETQMGWLDRTLRDLPNRPTFVIAHHNLQGPVPEGKKPHGLLDSDAMFAVLAKHKKVRAYIYGHTHAWEHSQHKATGIQLINLPPVAYVFNPDRPNGWVLASIVGENMEFELRSLNPNHDQHRQKVLVPLA